MFLWFYSVHCVWNKKNTYEKFYIYRIWEFYRWSVIQQTIIVHSWFTENDNSTDLLPSRATLLCKHIWITTLVGEDINKLRSSSVQFPSIIVNDAQGRVCGEPVKKSHSPCEASQHRSWWGKFPHWLKRKLILNTVICPILLYCNILFGKMRTPFSLFSQILLARSIWC